ncbi:MAG: C1 family peptidase [Bacteroidia bacterium]|nr:C1 family peptidase [Bacteroidia bacterium]
MLKYTVFLILWAFLLGGLLPAQGLKLDESAYNRVLLQPRLGNKNGTSESTLKVDLRPYCPPVQNQGKTATCTGWAVGYAALSIENAIRQGIEDDPDRLKSEAFSALFVYNQIKDQQIQGCSALSSIEAALKLLETKGNLKHNSFDRSGCGKIPSNSELDEAKNWRINEFRRLFKLDSNPKGKIKAVRKSLARKHPVIVGMFIKKDFYTQFGQDIYYMGHGPVTEAHAMVVVGYDDGRGREGAFLLMNSWGESWGNKGFIWMEYEAFGELCTRAYEMSLPKFKITKEFNSSATRSNSRKTQGSISLQRIEMRDSITFIREQPKYQDLYYRFPGKFWKVNDLFQIRVNGVTDEKYLYAFTYDADKGVKIHFPRDYQVDQKFGDKHESSIIGSPDREVILPEANIAFQLEKKGEEYICLLFASEPIKDIKMRVASLKNSTKPFPRAFSLYFGDLLFRSSNILYEQDKMRFYSRKGGVDKCIPILIKMNVE